MMLKVEPIRKYKTPGYPDKGLVLESPDILKTMPQRWKGKAFAGLAMSSIVLLLLSGCEKQQVTGGTPIPPFYLTEEEAYKVIVDEAEKYGVAFDKAGVELQELRLPFYDQAAKANAEYKMDIQLDGYNKEKKIGFEYVSNKDVEEFNNSLQQKPEEGVYPLWIDAYSAKLEQALREKDQGIYFDSFYTNGYEKAEVEKDLREQVKSFMEWLKAQGVI